MMPSKFYAEHALLMQGGGVWVGLGFGGYPLVDGCTLDLNEYSDNLCKSILVW